MAYCVSNMWLCERLKVCQQECDQYHDQLQKAQKKLLMEKKAVAAGEERIQKLERRLIFVTKVIEIMGQL